MTEFWNDTFVTFLTIRKRLNFVDGLGLLIIQLLHFHDIRREPVNPFDTWEFNRDLHWEQRS